MHITPNFVRIKLYKLLGLAPSDELSYTALFIFSFTTTFLIPLAWLGIVDLVWLYDYKGRLLCLRRAKYNEDKCSWRCQQLLPSGAFQVDEGTEQIELLPGGKIGGSISVDGYDFKPFVYMDSYKPIRPIRKITNLWLYYNLL